ncbi:hypothetical protein INR49_014695 [Caranx melampygus]|nr:hypothetical protein INR49_014695 [Caranx melampygus]
MHVGQLAPAERESLGEFEKFSSDGGRVKSFQPQHPSPVCYQTLVRVQDERWIVHLPLLQLWGTWFQTWLVSGYVEALASKLGMQVPDLTPKQVDMWQTRLSSHMGKAIGVSIGCILGMFPLFFLDDEKDKETEAQRCDEAPSHSS